MRILAEFFALLVGLGIKHRKTLFRALVGLVFSLVMLGVATRYGRYLVPFPLLFVLLGTIFVIKNWE